MNWFDRLLRRQIPAQARLPERQVAATAPMQARPSWSLSPFGFVSPYTAIPAKEQLALNDQLVQLIPLLNAAIDRLTQLVGCPEVESEDEEAAADFEQWWEQVPVNQIQTGGANLWAGLVKTHLVYGRGHVEIIPAASLTEIYALQLLHPRTLELRPRQDRYGVEVVQRVGGQQIVLDPALVLTVVHDIRDDNPNGTSLLYGLPTVGEIYNKLLASLKEVWERYGVPSYFAVYKPNENISDPTGEHGQAVLSSILANLREGAVRKANGQGADFGAVGDISLSIVGAAGEALDIEVPGRQLMEQMVAKLGLPSWMLGLHWSTTERMSSVETTLLGEMIDEVRSHLEGEFRYLVNLRQAFVGRPIQAFEVVWDAPSLIDRQAEAQAEKTEAEARAAALKVDERLWTLGMLSPWQVAERNVEALHGMMQADIEAALPDMLAEPPAAVSPFGAAPPPREGSEPAAGEPAPPFGRSLTYGNGRH